MGGWGLSKEAGRSSRREGRAPAYERADFLMLERHSSALPLVGLLCLGSPARTGEGVPFECLWPQETDGRRLITWAQSRRFCV